MRIAIQSCSSLLAILSLTGVLRAQQDVEGSKDHPLFTRMPNYYIYEFEQTDFEAHEFQTAGGQVVRIEGKKTVIQYFVKEDSKAASRLQIVRNYNQAVQKIGGTVVHTEEDSGTSVQKLAKAGSEIWAELNVNRAEGYMLTIVERGEMKQDVTAQSLLESLNKQGRVALYINFETAKTDIRPESQPVIDQIVAMMKSNPTLRISIEGHTDNVGNPQSNQVLSEQRARSVMAALIRQGIEARRMSAAGFGQERPSAENSTEEGRSKNRRVELVRQ